MTISAHEVAEWAALYQAGQSLRMIGQEYGCCHKTVLYAFRAHGITTRSRSCAHNLPPVQQPWTIDYCPDCGLERRIKPSTGWCWWCSTAQNHHKRRTPFGTIQA